MFIKPEHIPKHSVAALVKLDVSDRAIQKSDKDIAVGKYALPLITKARQDKSQHYWLDTVTKLACWICVCCNKNSSAPSEKQDHPLFISTRPLHAKSQPDTESVQVLGKPPSQCNPWGRDWLSRHGAECLLCWPTSHWPRWQVWWKEDRFGVLVPCQKTKNIRQPEISSFIQAGLCLVDLI